jgi:ribonuclease VapC
LTIFIDASAMISMMTGESDANELADQMEAEQSRLCSAISLWETIAGLCRSYTFSVPSARRVVQSFIALNEINFVTVGEREFELASQAYAEFGKGRHPAALNLGDCFAYACAKFNGAKLLFKGDDFTKTDISAL